MSSLRERSYPTVRRIWTISSGSSTSSISGMILLGFFTGFSTTISSGCSSFSTACMASSTEDKTASARSSSSETSCVFSDASSSVTVSPVYDQYNTPHKGYFFPSRQLSLHSKTMPFCEGYVIQWIESSRACRRISEHLKIGNAR